MLLRLVLGAAVGLALAIPAGALWVERKAAGRVVPLEAAPRRRVAVVLGARVDGERPTRALEARLEAALELFSRGTVSELLLTGANHGPHEDETAVMRAWLEARGVPNEALRVDGEGFRTIDSMRRARAVYGVQEALVVTQPFHMSRALFLARAAGIDALGVHAEDYVGAGDATNWLRETLARNRALLEVYLLRKLTRPNP